MRDFFLQAYNTGSIAVLFEWSQHWLTTLSQHVASLIEPKILLSSEICQQCKIYPKAEVGQQKVCILILQKIQVKNHNMLGTGE